MKDNETEVVLKEFEEDKTSEPDMDNPRYVYETYDDEIEEEDVPLWITRLIKVLSVVCIVSIIVLVSLIIHQKIKLNKFYKEHPRVTHQEIWEEDWSLFEDGDWQYQENIDLEEYNYFNDLD